MNCFHCYLENKYGAVRRQKKKEKRRAENFTLGVEALGVKLKSGGTTSIYLPFRVVEQVNILTVLGLVTRTGLCMYTDKLDAHETHLNQQLLKDLYKATPLQAWSGL
jgi:hypothetical protein